MRLDWADVRRAFAETWPYLLSHHLPHRRYRCYRLQLRGHRVDLCARCTGIYPGILAGLLGYFFAPQPFTEFVLVVTLPLPALIEWSVTSLGTSRGYNAVRTATGGLLGYGYGLGLGALFLSGDLRVLVVGLVYASLAGGLLALKRRRLLT